MFSDLPVPPPAAYGYSPYLYHHSYIPKQYPPNFIQYSTSPYFHPHQGQQQLAAFPYNETDEPDDEEEDDSDPETGEAPRLHKLGGYCLHGSFDASLSGLRNAPSMLAPPPQQLRRPFAAEPPPMPHLVDSMGAQQPVFFEPYNGPFSFSSQSST